jgi:antitoxin component YwqK of YwqJK toxin-antitoxin module
MAKVVRTYYDENNTKLKEEYYEVDGKKEGVYKSYHENGSELSDDSYNSKHKNMSSTYSFGQLWQICNYIDNKINGVFKSYYSNGQLKEMNNYIDGNIIEYKLYYNNGCKLSDNTEDSFGQLYMVCNYVDGKLEGEFKSYHENGQLKEIYNFINGVKQT